MTRRAIRAPNYRGSRRRTDAAYDFAPLLPIAQAEVTISPRTT